MSDAEATKPRESRPGSWLVAASGLVLAIMPLMAAVAIALLITVWKGPIVAVPLVPALLAFSARVFAEIMDKSM